MQSTMEPQQVQKIKADPRIRMASMQLLIYWGVAALLWIVGIVGLFTGSSPIDAQGQFSVGSFFNIFLFPIMMSLFAITHIYTIRAMKRIDQRRQFAAQGYPPFLASEQPFPNAQALSLPLTVRMRPRWRWFSLLATSTIITFALPILLAFYVGIYVDGHGLSNFNHVDEILIMLISLLAGVVLITAIMCFVIYIKGREQITLTDYGIIMAGAMPRTHSISWSEARLFAIINRPPFKRFKDSQSLMLELAGEHDTVRWTWLRRTSKWISFVLPMLPSDEYEVQMQKVLSVIAAKTGLSLYDIR